MMGTVYPRCRSARLESASGRDPVIGAERWQQIMADMLDERKAQR
jgi:hypothetical protein